MSAKKASDRRVKVRLGVDETQLAINANKPGRIVDVSRGGISFEYQSGEKWPETGVLSIDALHGEEDFYLDTVPVTMVTDFALQAQGPLCPCSRRRGLRFGELTDAQEAQLDKFIRITSTCKKHFRKS